MHYARFVTPARAAALALALVLAACGGDDSSSSDTTTTTAPDAADVTTTAPDAGEPAVDEEEADGPADLLTDDALCAIVPPEAVEAAVGTAPTEIRAAGSLCELGFGGYVLRVQQYAGVFEPLEGLSGSPLTAALQTFLQDAGEEPEPIDDIAAGAFQVRQGWVYLTSGANLLLIDNGSGTLPDDFDGPTVFRALAAAAALNL